MFDILNNKNITPIKDALNYHQGILKLDKKLLIGFKINGLEIYNNISMQTHRNQIYKLLDTLETKKDYVSYQFISQTSYDYENLINNIQLNRIYSFKNKNLSSILNDNNQKIIENYKNKSIPTKINNYIFIYFDYKKLKIKDNNILDFINEKVLYYKNNLEYKFKISILNLSTITNVIRTYFDFKPLKLGEINLNDFKSNLIPQNYIVKNTRNSIEIENKIFENKNINLIKSIELEINKLNKENKELLEDIDYILINKLKIKKDFLNEISYIDKKNDFLENIKNIEKIIDNEDYLIFKYLNHNNIQNFIFYYDYTQNENKTILTSYELNHYDVKESINTNEYIKHYSNSSIYEILEEDNKINSDLFHLKNENYTIIENIEFYDQVSAYKKLKFKENLNNLFSLFKNKESWIKKSKKIKYYLNQNLNNKKMMDVSLNITYKDIKYNKNLFSELNKIIFNYKNIYWNKINPKNVNKKFLFNKNKFFINVEEYNFYPFIEENYHKYGSVFSGKRNLININFDTKETNNGFNNIAIFGNEGSGKTTLINKIILDTINDNQQIILINFDSEKKIFKNFLNANIIEVSEYCLNPFKIYPEIFEHDKEYFYFNMVSILSDICKNYEKDFINLCYEIISMTFEDNNGNLNKTNIINNMVNPDLILNIMKNHTVFKYKTEELKNFEDFVSYGKYNNIFDINKKTINLNNNFVNFTNFSNYYSLILKKDLIIFKSLFHLILLEIENEYKNKNENHSKLIIDNDIFFSLKTKNDEEKRNLNDFIENFIRKSRKLNNKLILTGNSLSYALNNNYSILNYMETIIQGKININQGSLEDIKLFKKYFNEKEEQEINNLDISVEKYNSYYFKNNLNSFVFSYYPTDFEKILLEMNYKESKFLYHIQKELNLKLTTENIYIIISILEETRKNEEYYKKVVLERGNYYDIIDFDNYINEKYDSLVKAFNLMSQKVN